MPEKQDKPRTFGAWKEERDRISNSPERVARRKAQVEIEKSLTPEEFGRQGPVVVRPDLGWSVELMDGETVCFESVRFVDPDVQALSRLAARFVERGRGTRSPWIVATAHILSAVARALSNGDCDALAEPHRWARGRLRPAPSENTITTGLRGYIPVEDAKGRLTDSLAPGYDALTSALVKITKACRANSRTIGICSDLVTELLLDNFPWLSSLNAPDKSVSEEELWLAIRTRVHLQLDAQWKKCQTVHDPFSAAAEIAESLLRTELRLCGRTPEQIESEFRFLNARAQRPVNHE